MIRPIAKIKLAPGNIGFYDSLTGIRLTKASPEAVVYSGENTSNLKKAIQEGKVLLIEGSLSSYLKQPVYKKEVIREKDVPVKKESKKQEPVKKETKEVKMIEVAPKKQSIQNLIESKKSATNTNAAKSNGEDTKKKDAAKTESSPKEKE